MHKITKMHTLKPSILMGDLKQVGPSGVIPNLEVDATDEVLFD